MKKSILISLVVIFAYGNAVACDIFNGPYSSPSYYGCNNGSIEVTTDFNLISGNFFILYRYGNPVSNWIEVPDNSSFTWHDLAPGDYVVYFQEKIGGNIWCSESRGVNVPDVSLTYNFNAYSINATTPSCSNAQISGGGNYAVNGTATAFKDRKSTRLNSSHVSESRMPSSA